MEEKKPGESNIMVTISSIFSGDESRNEVEDSNRERDKAVPIRLNCMDFGTFNGRADQWIAFKENILSKAGVDRYSQFLKADF